MKSRSIYAGLFLLLFAVSCRRNYDYLHDVSYSDVLVCADWSALEEDPSGATILFFPEDGSKAAIIRTNNVTRCHAYVKEGVYTVILMNRSFDEFSSMRFDGTDKLAALRCTLRDKLSSWLGQSSNIRTVYEPEDIVIGRKDHFIVHSRTDPAHAQDSLCLSPKSLVYESFVSVRLNGIENLRSARGYIGGLSDGCALAGRTASDSASCFILENWSICHDRTDYTKGCITAYFRSFGLTPASADSLSKQKNNLYIEFLLVDGETVLKRNIDFTRNLVQRSDRRTLEIAVGTLSSSADTALTLPFTRPSGGEESFFRAEIESWSGPEEIEIKI